MSDKTDQQLPKNTSGTPQADKQPVGCNVCGAARILHPHNLSNEQTALHLDSHFATPTQPTNPQEGQFEQAVKTAICDVLQKSDQYSNISWSEPDLGSWRQQLEVILDAHHAALVAELEGLRQQAMQAHNFFDNRNAPFLGAMVSVVTIDAAITKLKSEIGE